MNPWKAEPTSKGYWWFKHVGAPDGTASILLVKHEHATCGVFDLNEALFYPAHTDDKFAWLEWRKAFGACLYQKVKKPEAER